MCCVDTTTVQDMNGSYASNGEGHGGEGGLLGLKQQQDLSPIYTNNKHHHHQQPEHECGYNGGVSQDTSLGVQTCDLLHDNTTAGTRYPPGSLDTDMKVLCSPLILNSDSCHDHLQFPMTSLLEQLSYYKVVDYEVLSFSILFCTFQLPTLSFLRNCFLLIIIEMF